MKEIVVKEDRTIYEAIDGTKFSDKSECGIYEESAKCVIQSRFKRLIIGEYNGWELMGGYEEHVVYALSLKTERDVEIALQRFYLDNTHLYSGNNEELRKKIEDKFYSALETNSPMLVGVNYEGELYALDTVKHYIDNLSAIAELVKQK